MRSIVYVGPIREGVVIAATGQRAVPGKPISVDAKIAGRLLKQAVWQPAGTVRRSRNKET